MSLKYVMEGCIIKIIAIVEVRGVEPRSEEKIPKTSTCVSCLLISHKETPPGWIYLTPTQVIRLSTDLLILLEYKNKLSHRSDVHPKLDGPNLSERVT